MAINFPLSFPTTPSFKRLEIRELNVIGVSESPTSLEQQVYEWDGDRWEMGVTWPMMARSSAEPIIAILSALRGRRGKVILGPCGEDASPRGTATGTPFVLTDHSSRSLTLATTGWTVSLTGIMKAGDYLQIAKNFLSYPTAFNNAAWIKTQCSVTGSDSITDPIGTTTAERIDPDVGATNAFVYQVASSPTDSIASRSVSFSVWLKAATGTPTIDIQIANQSGGGIASLACVLSTSWQRFTVTGTMGATDTGARGYIGGGTNAWTAAKSSIDAWGASLWSPTLDIYLHKICQDVNSSASGAATLDIWPKTRVTIPDFSKVITSSPKGLFRLASNHRTWTKDEAGNYSVGAEFVEAL